MISSNAETLLKQRYFIDENEDWRGLCHRVIDNVCKGESDLYKQKMYVLLSECVFIPNSPALVNAGKTGQGLMACFVVGPTEDNLENHLDTLKSIAQIAKKGGGAGFTGSFMRAEGSRVAGSAHGYAYGPNRWAGSVSAYLDMMTQAGFRKMAMMYTLSSNHPDLDDFINLKQTLNERDLYNFNQSVFATNEWMTKATVDLNSKEHHQLWKIAQHAWNNGEPGLLFDDTINNSPYAETGQKIYGTNPCGEQPLPPYGSCNLGSINLAHPFFFDEDGKFDFEKLEEVSKLATRFLDNVGTVNTFPNKQFKQWYDENRPIGIGVMGYADALLQLKIQYGKPSALVFLDDVMRHIKDSSYDASIELGKEKGIPSRCEIFGRRNITTVSIAPTGSIAFIAGCSHGIEPIFSPDYTRTDERGQAYVVKHPLADMSYFTSVIGHTNSPTFKEHIKVVAVAQQNVDSGVSKTCNAPQSTTVQEIYDAFVYAWQTGCKGITVYRDNSRDVQVVNHNTKPIIEEPDVEICPITGEPHNMVFEEGCANCSDCGYSFCSIG